jgi:methyl-accepting chemotaxis protein
MKSLSALKISTRLYLSFAVISVLVAVLGALALIKIGIIRDEFALVMKDRYPTIEEVIQIKDAVNENARKLRNLFIMSDPAQLQQERAAIGANDALISDKLAALDKTINSPIGAILLANVADARTAYKEPRDAMLKALEDAKRDVARATLLDDVRPKQAAYMAALDGLITYQNELMVDSGNNVQSAVDSALLVVPSIALAIVVLGIYMSVSIVRSTVRPINEAVAVARAVAEGNLAVDVQAGGTNETGLLLDALHDMKGRLSTIVTRVRSSSESVASASAQIAQGNDDMSGRTEKQASALQETAAAMEQLQSAVRQNADSAGKANDMAANASAIATRGGAVVQQVVATMQQINESSRKISDIIGVIDGIAFQTNILALNAAVEAARAGEQGRGFAVVASEVRSLAQRSADAARQIKVLIGASVECVDSGTLLADRAGATMQDIVSSVKSVSTIIGDISRSSREQSDGVVQVGEAITQMDQVTQQNAALVEESAASAQGLREQAGQLVAAVAVFRVAALPA